MNLITTINSYPLQSQNVSLPDGSKFTFTMYYVPMQFGWFFTKINYDDFNLNGFRISNSPNMLYQYQNQIPFGLACFTAGNREPTQQQDFASGLSKIYILSNEEVLAYTDYMQGGELP